MEVGIVPRGRGYSVEGWVSVDGSLGVGVRGGWGGSENDVGVGMRGEGGGEGNVGRGELRHW